MSRLVDESTAGKGLSDELKFSFFLADATAFVTHKVGDDVATEDGVGSTFPLAVRFRCNFNFLAGWHEEVTDVVVTELEQSSFDGVDGDGLGRRRPLASRRLVVEDVVEQATAGADA
jgi:hypothetical protein